MNCQSCFADFGASVSGFLFLGSLSWDDGLDLYVWFLVWDLLALWDLDLYGEYLLVRLSFGLLDLAPYWFLGLGDL